MVRFRLSSSACFLVVFKDRADQLPIIEQTVTREGLRFLQASCEHPIITARGPFWLYVEQLKKKIPGVQVKNSEPVWVLPVTRRLKTDLFLPGQGENLQVRNPATMALKNLAGGGRGGVDGAPSRRQTPLRDPLASASPVRRGNLPKVRSHPRAPGMVVEKLRTAELVSQDSRREGSKGVRSTKARGPRRPTPLPAARSQP